MTAYIRSPLFALPFVLPLAFAACGDASNEADASAEAGSEASETSGAGPAHHFEIVEAPEGQQLAEAQLTVLVRVVDEQDVPVVGYAFNARARLGGGVVQVPEGGVFESSAEGTPVYWTLGVAPVGQRLRFTPADEGEALEPLALDLDARRDAPAGTQTFGDIEAWLMDEGNESTTEDLAFSPNGYILMGAGAQLLEVDTNGLALARTLSGDPVGAAIGVAYDASGRLFVANGGTTDSLLRVETDGAVSTLATTNGTDPLLGPNYIAIAPGGEVLLSDPCLGQVIAYDAETGATLGTLDMDRPTQGGPNGIAVSPDGSEIYFVTENTALVCGQVDEVDIQANLAGLYKADLAALLAGDSPTAELLFDGLGQYGDGIAFDAEENLHFIVDTAENGVLNESLVLVKPKDVDEVRMFLKSEPGSMYANLAFGQGVFGETNMYISLLTIPGLPLGVRRGLESAPVGIAGWPLLPQ